MDQVHGNRIQEISLASSPVKQTDAMISRSSDLILGVLTADCLPIAISNRTGSEFAIIHAGWRGLLSGIIEKCLSNFIIDSTNLFAWIGPSISSEHYEVGSDLYDAFLLSDENSESHFKKLKSEKWLFNIQGEAERILRKHKVKVQNSGECSYSNDDLFYSYRRNQTQNRLLTIIWRSK
jgi:YfiH family protein